MVCEANIQLQQPNQSLKDATAVGQGIISSSQAILHFNWDKRAQAKACMQTLVMALADDPVNSYFSGSKRVKFCKDEVRSNDCGLGLHYLPSLLVQDWHRVAGCQRQQTAVTTGQDNTSALNSNATQMKSHKWRSGVDETHQCGFCRSRDT